MSRRRLQRGNIKGSHYRALLTDTCPDDVPIIFSNDGFRRNVERKARSFGLIRIIDSIINMKDSSYTIPYRYQIRLNSLSTRQLSLAHPTAQIRACDFYNRYGHLIPYFCRHTDISLRRPVKIGSSFFYYGPAAERKRYRGAAIDLLLHDRAVRNPGSFFAYSGYDRLYKFFNSDEFLDLEKRFSAMRLADVSKCFSSIYSHTLAWAVKDIQHGKEHGKAVSFANDFDQLMQYANYKETNGIPVGSELSRIFAEIILQSVDRQLIDRCSDKRMNHKIDYHVRRYVDDYIIFANGSDALDEVQRQLADALKQFNLHLNDSKTNTLFRPLQTRNSQIVAGATPGLENFRAQITTFNLANRTLLPKAVRNPKSLVRTFINDIKVACTNGEAGYEEVCPFIIGSLNTTIERLISDRPSAPPAIKRDAILYARTFETLLRALYYFFTLHSTIRTSYQVAQSTLISIRFFQKYIRSEAEGLYEFLRTAIQDVITNPTLNTVGHADCIPIELLNIILAASELPYEYTINVHDIRTRVLDDKEIDYFSIVTLLFFFNTRDATFASDLQKRLRRDFLVQAAPNMASKDCHLLLDLIACPYLSVDFRRECCRSLLKRLCISETFLSNLLLDEILENPWFIKWPQIDLLNHLRKKELRVVY